ncbi:16S rRNA (guanine(966)-N(2))-methyltransferase RsmD [Acetobacterium tundrae]|uniref:16S rRNA (Guanine(966)-N(2))-methyltransferase RsmD n=1 Tax=Acetobacterium tundrae TaxID=132932 RepID=A0ABR6WG30_9FIRM|nr:16S rRNA (guanine(966)-N(2))-methyltransferase RsmD [Acetobacterium tundrae]MBC3795481.1 16S rRNA (guanine(966)-N(2))-methyltransferase RsmD [Acetobacterium tundrae]
MRIIAGEKRGKKLMSFPGDKIRPTTDKVKGAIFNSLQNEVREAKVFVDLFAGTGAMGIEALSRGVETAYFFDLSQDSVQIIKKNLALTGYESRAKVFNLSAEKGLEWLYKNKVNCDIIFMDPPYAQGEETISFIEMISEKEILSGNGKLVIESKISVIMPIEKKNLTCYKSKKYGITTVSYYAGENYE